MIGIKAKPRYNNVSWFCFAEVMKVSQIIEVIPREDYCIEVALDNGSRIILNLKNRLETLRFGMLTNKELFYSVTTDGSYIRWGNEIEISINEVFQFAQK